ncbi:MAG: PAS domain S-box protein, partial [Pseudomonadota bacterium]
RKKRRILIVENDEIIAGDIAESLQGLGYEAVGGVCSGKEALRAAEQCKPDLVLMAVDLQGNPDGIEAGPLIRARMDVPVVYMKGRAEDDIPETAEGTESYGALVKPLEAHELKISVEIALYKHEADLKVRESEARRVEAEERSRESNRRLNESQRIAGMGTWEWRAFTGETHWSDEAYRIFGLEPRSETPSYALAARLTHPEDIGRWKRTIKDALESTNGFTLNYRALRPDGTVVWIHNESEIVRGSEGRVIRVWGTLQDITDRKEAEQLILIQRDLALGLSASTDLKTAVDLFLSSVMEMSGADSAGMYLREHDGSWRLEHHKGVSETLLSLASRLEADSAEGRLIEMGRPVELGPLFDLLSPGIRDAVKREGLAAVFGIPLAHEGKAVGCLLVGSRRFLPVSERVRSGLEGIAAQVAGAIVRISAQEAGRRSEEKSRAIFEQCPIGISVVSFDGRFLKVNQGFREMLGYSEQELSGMTIADVSHPDDLAEEAPLIEKMLRNEIASYACEKRVFRKNGEIARVNVTVTTIRDAQGIPVYGIGMVHDLTAGRLTEEALHQSELRFRYLYENLRDGMAAVDAGGRIVLCNSRFEQMLGYSQEELAELTYEDITPAQWHAGESRILVEQVDVRGYSELYEKEYIRKNGTVFPIEIQTYKVKDRSGWSAAYWALVREITDRKTFAEKLRESEERYRNLVETSNLAIFISEAEGVLIHANPRMVEMTGYADVQDLMGVSTERLYPEPSDRARLMRELLEKGSATNFEIHGVKKDGSSLWTSLNAVMQRDDSGNVTGIFAIAEDITERKKMRDALHSALDEKEVLLREIHHRVKNNLAVVISLLGFQGRHAKDEYHRKMFVESQDRIRSMALAHEKLYQAENLSEIDSRSYLTSLLDHLMSALGNVGSEVRLVRQIARTDLDLETGVTLGFIVTELVSNALKHAFPGGRPGTISLTLKEVDDSTLELSLADDGVGLPDSIQFANPRSLGLNLVRIFSKQLRGELEVRRNHGTEVILRFNHRQRG